MKSIQCFLIFFLFFQAPNYSQNKNKNKSPSVLDHTQSFNCFFDFTYSHKKDLIYLTVKELDNEFLYVNSLSQGMGNNDISLDRGQLGSERVVFFSKSGNKLMLIQPNLRYRSTSENPLEQRSVKEAFAKSVLFGFPIIEITKEGYLIDLTPFLMSDAHGVSKRLEDLNEGSFEIDKSRSAVSLERTKAFPKNIELDMMLTFVGDPTGNLVHSVTPSP